MHFLCFDDNVFEIINEANHAIRGGRRQHDIVFRPFDLVWLSYGPGQMLIVFGTAAFVTK